MGSLFRSEDMSLCSMYLQAETTYSCVAELGELGIVQFKDLNADVQTFQRKYVGEVRRCEEMERQLRYFERELQKEAIPVITQMNYPLAPAPRELIDLEATFERLESQLKEFGNNIDALKKNQSDLIELKHVLLRTEEFFLEVSMGEALGEATATPAPTGPAGDGQYQVVPGSPVTVEMKDFEVIEIPPEHKPHLRYVAGVLLQEKLPGFMRLLWFACRGNALLKYVEIDTLLQDSYSGNLVKKTVFMVFFQGVQLEIKVRKICEGFRASLYPCPETSAERREMRSQVNQRLEDLETVINTSVDQRRLVLNTVSENLENWQVVVVKVKAIYHTLNMFHTRGQNFVAECWLPTAEISTAQMILNKSTEAASLPAPSLISPMVSTGTMPSYFRTNKFTSAFQTIIDSYGVAVYKEVNPVPFSIITFPFLFSVMFGDLGHGLLLFAFGLWMVIRERHLAGPAKTSEIYSIIFGGRYLILMMGIFSVYSGLIYNDIFSKTMNIFGAQWHMAYDFPTIQSNSKLTLDPNDPDTYKGSPYAFGVDPVWQLSENKITFLNSFKEKISVTMGISQMLLGVILSIFNHVHFKRPLNIACEFVPQMIFLLSIFGYLVILIFVKWIAFTPAMSSIAPNLLIGFINMFLFNYGENSGSPIWFPGQEELQKALVIIAFFCAMWMLLSKPLILKYRHDHANKSRIAVNASSSNQHGGDANAHASSSSTRSKRGSASSYTIDVNEGTFIGDDMTDDKAQILPQTLGGDGDAAPQTDHHSGDGDHTDVGERSNGGSVGGGELTKRSLAATVASSSSDGGGKDDGNSGLGGGGGSNASATGGHDDGGEQFEFSEVFIHQAIHTIEFCLGCVSHTASYLRLWALSLAHAQLSEVLWSMILHIGFIVPGYAGCVVIFMVFAPFACLTVAILICMEGLSAFLHTLRLHWVEFQSKFYSGDGIGFLPFSFQKIIESSKN